MKPFHNRRYELSCEQGCVLWGIRVIAPAVLKAHCIGNTQVCVAWRPLPEAVGGGLVWMENLNNYWQSSVVQCVRMWEVCFLRCLCIHGNGHWDPFKGCMSIFVRKEGIIFWWSLTAIRNAWMWSQWHQSWLTIDELRLIFAVRWVREIPETEWNQTYLGPPISPFLKYIHTYVIDHSPLGLFRANETNNWNENNKIKMGQQKDQSVLSKVLWRNRCYRELEAGRWSTGLEQGVERKQLKQKF